MSSFAQAAASTNAASKAIAEPQQESALLISQISASVREVGPLCAAAAAPACLSAVAGMPAAEMDTRTVDGLRGDYIGGVFGTIASVVTMLVVFLAWNTSRKTDYTSKAYQVFAEMLRTHEEILSSIQVGEAKGRDAIGHILSEFDFIYKTTKTVAAASGWDLRQRIDIAYTYTYYGPKRHTMIVLSQYSRQHLFAVNNAIAVKSRTMSKRTKGRRFTGHQNRLAHYFRNLYAAYSFIESSKLTKKQKLDLGKILRSKLSNYEQALLVLNIRSHLGETWEDGQLVDFYMPIKNVPEHFFEFDKQFEMKKQFPGVTFEWEKKPSLQRFGWRQLIFDLNLGKIRAFVRSYGNK